MPCDSPQASTGLCFLPYLKLPRQGLVPGQEGWDGVPLPAMGEELCPGGFGQVGRWSRECCVCVCVYLCACACTLGHESVRELTAVQRGLSGWVPMMPPRLRLLPCIVLSFLL